jgi:pyruvate dehydrogenase E1 component beta subunit
LPYGEAAVRREGTDVTVVAFGILVPMALEAAATLEGRVSAEIIDPRTLKPFDYDTVMASLGKTGGRLVVCDNSYRTGGVASWLVGELTIRRPGLIRHVELVTAPDSTVPYARSLAQAFFPDATKVQAAIERVARA